VILSARRLTATTLSPDASKVLCFAGAGIFDLKEKLAQHGRAAHTELGSIFLNPSVGAGVAFGSGGTQLRVCVRPSWTPRP
jgi:FAD/FMN-containing dehydrogenase